MTGVTRVADVSIDDGTAAGVRILATGCSRFSWTAGTIKQHAGTRTGVYGLLHLQNVAASLVDVVTIIGGSSTGIFIAGGAHHTLRNITVRDTLADGVHVSRGATDVTIAVPTVVNSGDDAIGIIAVTDEPTTAQTYQVVKRVIISDAQISGMTAVGGGISIVGADTVSICGGVIDGIPTGGIKITDDAPAGVPQLARNVTVNGTIVRNAENGLSIGIAERCQVIGVQAVDNREAGVATVGATQLLVTGGQFSGNQFGIYEASGTGNHVIGADLRGNSLGPSQVSSAVLMSCITS